MLEPLSASVQTAPAELERRSRELETLHAVGRAIADTLDPTTALRRALDLLVAQGWFTCGEALLWEDAAAARAGDAPETVAVGRCAYAAALDCPLKPDVDREAAAALDGDEVHAVGGWRFVPIEGRAVLALIGADRSSPSFLAGVADLVGAALKRGALHARLAEKEAQRSRLLRALLNAQEEERGRISRDLHDQIGQALTALLLGIERNAEQPDADDLRRLKELTSVTLNDVRRIALDLRPSVLDELGLEAALKRFARDLHDRFGLAVSLLVKLPDRLGRQEETVLYRVAQEALINVVRHARTNEASVVVTVRDDCAHLVVEDAGVGFDPDAFGPAERIGLIGMRERVELLGGSLRIESRPGQGVALYARVPLRRS